MKPLGCAGGLSVGTTLRKILIWRKKKLAHDHSVANHLAVDRDGKQRPSLGRRHRERNLQSLPEAQHRNSSRRTILFNLLAVAATQVNERKSGDASGAAAALDEDGAEILPPRDLLPLLPFVAGRRRRSSDADEDHHRSVSRTNARADELPLPPKLHLSDTSVSLPSPPWPARGQNIVA
jgi:hypothetical protein